MIEENGKYIDAKVLDWWRDYDLDEYIVIIEINSEWRLLITKVDKSNGKL